MEIIYVFLSAFCFFLVLVFLLTYYKKNRAEKMLKIFDAEKLNKIEIGFSEVSYSSFRQNGGISSKATLYYNERLLIFTPKKNSVFSSILNSLPLILILKTDNKLPREFNYKIIDKIIIKTDEFILSFLENTLTTKMRKEITVFSEKENPKLNEIFTKFSENKILTSKILN